jgi:hypothetical protein
MSLDGILSGKKYIYRKDHKEIPGEVRTRAEH